ncbi:hypothetical protein K8R03_03010 [Candidatus Kaiserbacteria bacterium]|nr:hypothetical protein [Candidatus Kaiserbacteria bacterium]
MNFWRNASIVSVGTLLLTPFAAAAQSATLSNKIVTCDGVNCTVCNLADTAQNLLNTGIYVMIILSAVMFAWAGFQALTSGGNSEKYTSARRIFGNVVIGLVIVLTGWIVIDTLMKTLVGDGKLGPWNKVCMLFEGAFQHPLA